MTSSRASAPLCSSGRSPLMSLPSKPDGTRHGLGPRLTVIASLEDRAVSNTTDILLDPGSSASPNADSPTLRRSSRDCLPTPDRYRRLPFTTSCCTYPNELHQPQPFRLHRKGPRH